MKKALSLTLALVMVLALAACGGTSGTQSQQQGDSSAAPAQQEASAIPAAHPAPAPATPVSPAPAPPILHETARPRTLFSRRRRPGHISVATYACRFPVSWSRGSAPLPMRSPRGGTRFCASAVENGW